MEFLFLFAYALRCDKVGSLYLIWI